MRRINRTLYINAREKRGGKMIDEKEYTEWELGRLQRQVEEYKTRLLAKQYEQMKKLKEEKMKKLEKERNDG